MSRAGGWVGEAGERLRREGRPPVGADVDSGSLVAMACAQEAAKS